MILSQIRMIDKKRLTHKLVILEEGDFNQVKEKLKALVL
ncbi:type II toxin-antitoxin system PemK/MazF family toxin [Haliscomenobacter sp.]